ncbi:MAG: hypothetical protein KGI89_02855 [Euryarchaeota archaeon]|nr:hypothetical protein [Euryarchaeota archaeon]
MSEETATTETPSAPTTPTTTPTKRTRAPAKARTPATKKAAAPKAPAREPLGETVQVGVRIPVTLVAAKHKLPREGGGFAGVLRAAWEAGHKEHPAKVAEGTKMTTRTIGFPPAVAKAIRAYRDTEGNDFNGWVIAVLQRALKA